MTGIVSYGTYIPRFRISLSDVADAWKKNPEEIKKTLGVTEKSVPAIDEDAVTIALESAHSCLSVSSFSHSDIEALFVGSESHPYAVNPTSTIVGELLGIGNTYLAADMEFACKAGTAGMLAVSGLVSSGQIRMGIAVGTDAAQSKTHDALEYTSAAAGAAYMIGSHDVSVGLLDWASFSSDTPDFWRRDGIRYPSHAGRFTGEPAYFAHVLGAAKLLMKKTGIHPEDVDYCVFHMPNGKFPRDAAKRLGFTKEQLAPSLVVDAIGNPYSASAMLGLAAVLDVVKPHQKIFMVSYGSGAGSDAFLWETTTNIRSLQRKRRKEKMTVIDHIQRKTMIDYVEYLKKTHKI
jgi:hydroxymethylglutaryl-CoA synthase